MTAAAQYSQIGQTGMQMGSVSFELVVLRRRSILPLLGDHKCVAGIVHCVVVRLPELTEDDTCHVPGNKIVSRQ